MREPPEFALGAGLAGLRWLAHGYEVTGVDGWSALANTLDAARVVGCEDSVRAQIRALVEAERRASWRR